MKTRNILIAGFGGQGVLFTGKIMAYAGLLENKEISWLPSYGPEMRGGTANCSVCISELPIGSPLVLNPDILIVMNAPSFTKFIDTAAPGAKVIVDSALVEAKTTRTDVDAYYIPATTLAAENGLDGLSNMIILGKALKESGFADYASVKAAVEKSVPARKSHLLESNLKAIELGMNF